MSLATRESTERSAPSIDATAAQTIRQETPWTQSNGHSKTVTPRSMNSMTLAINHDNAARMLEASRSLNAQLHKIILAQKQGPKSIHICQNGETRDTVSSPSCGSASTSSSSSFSQHSMSNGRPSKLQESHYIHHILEAAEKSDNPLLTTFLSEMKASVEAGVFSREEMITCLLVFLDSAGKSHKLLLAFDQLSGSDSSSSPSMPREPQKDKDSPSQHAHPTVLSLDQEGLVKLFHCFLLSISTCIHYDGSASSKTENNDLPCSHENTETAAAAVDTCKASVSPDLGRQDNKADQSKWALPSHVRRDILEIANYATAKLMEHFANLSKESSSLNDAKDSTLVTETDIPSNQHCDSNEPSKDPNPTPPIRVSFQQFGEWYNHGGFSLVPWLELLDLNKWHVAGRSVDQTKSAKAVRAPQQQRTDIDSGANVNQVSKSSSISTNDSCRNMKEKNGNHIVHVGGGIGVLVESEQHLAPEENNLNTSSTGNMDGKDSAADAHERTVPLLGPEHLAQPYSNNCPVQNTQHSLRIETSSLPPPQSVPSVSTKYVFSCELGAKKEFRLHLSAENIDMVKELVHKTGLYNLSSTHVYTILQKHTKFGSGIYQGIPVIYRQDLPSVVRDLVPTTTSNIFTTQEMERFSSYFTIFFLSFARNANDTNFQSGLDQVIAKELAVGFSFLCAGKKSHKLDEAFKIMSDNTANVLSNHKLLRFIRSYLRMLLGISLLSRSPNLNAHHTNGLLGVNAMSGHISSLCFTTEVGSSWIMNNFLQHLNVKNGDSNSNIDKISFQDFADWYKNGGYNLAPWFELLDLSKLSGLAQAPGLKPQPPIQLNRKRQTIQYKASERNASVLSPAIRPLNPPTSTGKIRSFDEFIDGTFSPNPKKRKLQSSKDARHFDPDVKEILSTFPLSDGRSLIVLREDAAYVRSVVEQFGLLESTPDYIWNKLFSYSKKHVPKPLPRHQASLHKSGCGKSCDLEQKTFVEGVLKSIPSKLRKRKSQPPLASTPKDTLENFYLSYDMNQVNRVAANQLMGGLTLFCGGSKTTKLSFIFNLFAAESDDSDNKKDDDISLTGKDVFYFLRSVLIVLFSCCKQSLELTAGPVGIYIADAANKVTNDVMKYQWKARKVDRINFDEFGEWYNKGGYEIAPWIELLDLEKWAFLDEEKADKMLRKSLSDIDPQTSENGNQGNQNVQITKTPDKSAHRSFFSPRLSHDDGFDPFDPDIGDMGDIGDIDCFDVDFGFDMLPKDSDNVMTDHLGTDSFQPPSFSSTNECAEAYPYQFKLSVDENNHRVASVLPNRVHLLKTILLESGLNETSIGCMCNSILNAGDGTTLTRFQYERAVKAAIGQRKHNMQPEIKQILDVLLLSIFDQFTKADGKANASEIACGLIVLCKGRKSEKLEYAFDVLDNQKEGRFSRAQMISFLRSFLIVIFYISSCELGSQPAHNILSSTPQEHLDDTSIIYQVSSWVTESVFAAAADITLNKHGEETINFDNFADWYTKGGHENNNWLELLDMEKWILTL